MRRPDYLSIEEILRWLNSKFGHGHMHKTPELPWRAFARTVGMDVSQLHRVMDGKIRLQPHQQRLFSRFIHDWEHGRLAHQPLKVVPGKGRLPAQIVHVENPRPRPPRFVIEDALTRPRMKLLARPPMGARLPSFKDVFAGLRSKG